MSLRWSVVLLATVGLASCGPESTELEPAALPMEVESVDTLEGDLSFAPMALAAFDAALGAPKCGTVAAVCDTGTLVQGRGGVGPETNAPNTIRSACADGNVGDYQIDESLEALKVSTVDGTGFAPGKQVTIEAKAWVYDPAFDELDLYYAADANNPAWVLIATLVPAASGTQTLQATHILEAGSLQAIRGVLRATPSSSPCAIGAFDDHDDLVFAVGTNDTTPPTTAITAPATGSTVSGTVPVSASASDDVGVTKVEFYVGATRIGTDTTAPYSLSWNTTTGANGIQLLTSKAYDASGKVTTSATVGVTVRNGACTTVQNLLANPGFESGNVSWQATQGVIGSDAANARTGSWRATFLSVNTTLESMAQQITIPTTACDATLTFWVKVISSEPVGSLMDTLEANIMDSSNRRLEAPVRITSQNATGSYMQVTMNLMGRTNYRGQPILVHFRSTVAGIRDTRFYVDDVALRITR
jgi:hypothetical protein